MKIALALIAIGVATAANAGAVKGYVKKDGTYVAPSYRSSPNSTTLDNYSSKPNYNPYSGKAGTVDPYAPKPLPNPYGGGAYKSLYDPK